MKSKPIYILSTKKLSSTQLSLLPDHIDITQQPLIKIDHHLVRFKQIFKIAVFTSQNAVNSVFELSKNTVRSFQKIYAIQGKTVDSLEKLGLNITAKATCAKELSRYIINNENSCNSIHFFCGNLTEIILPETLSKKGFKIIKHKVYTTSLLLFKFEKKFDIVLFFSPSAIRSYVNAQNSLQIKAFCIGNTTANYAKKYFEKVKIAKTSSVENVLRMI